MSVTARKQDKGSFFIHPDTISSQREHADSLLREHNLEVKVGSDVEFFLLHGPSTIDAETLIQLRRNVLNDIENRGGPDVASKIK